MSKSREDKVHSDLRDAVDAVAKSRPDGGDTILTYAVKTGNHDLVEHLLTERKLTVDAPDSLKNTGLYIAVENQDLKMVDLLLKHGANPNIPNGKGMEPIVRAYELANEAMFDKLIDKTNITPAILAKVDKIEEQLKNPEVTIQRREHKSGGKEKVAKAVDEVAASTKNIYTSFLEHEKAQKAEAVKSLDQFIKDNIKTTVSTYKQPEKEPIAQISRSVSAKENSNFEASRETVRKQIK